MAMRSRSTFRSISTFVAMLSVFAIPTIGLSACGPIGPFFASSQATPTHSPNTSRPTRHPFKFVVVGDGSSTDPFWSLVKKGADQAASDMGVSASYLAPKSFSASEMSNLIDSAVATQPSGLVISIPDCTALSPAIHRAQLVGVSVISIYSGSTCANKLGLLNYIGQSDYDAGLAAGSKLTQAGASHVLCVSGDASNIYLADRCRGVKDAMLKAGGESDALVVDLSNPNNAQQTILARLTQDPSINGAITLDATSAGLAIAASQHLIRA